MSATNGPSIPRDRSLDGAIGVFREGFNYMPGRFRKFGTDLFRTRFIGQKTICIHGPEAVELFYDERKFQRSKAIPRRGVTSLFGKNAVHTHDDEVRRNRKEAFLSLMTDAALQRLVQIMAGEWRQAISRWQTMPKVVLFDESLQLLTRSICQWAGVPLEDPDVRQRANDFCAMIDAFGGVGPRLWRGKLARRRTQKWIVGLIEEARKNPPAHAHDALHVMALHRGPDGNVLDVKTAAVELINVLRPTTALAWYIAFAAKSLHENPAARETIATEPTGDHAGEAADWFMQEVRRFYPFAPFLGALVREPFIWRDYQFEKGTLVLLDVYGTNHDGRTWPSPDEFQPQRFVNWQGSPFDFIPQGGGHPATGHRCPGEWITMNGVTLALHYLTRCMTYEFAPNQDTGFSLARMPTRPRSGIVLQKVRPTDRLNAPAPPHPSLAATAGRKAARGVAV